MALVPYDNSSDWLDVKRRYFDTEIVPSDLWPSPSSWAAYRSYCNANGYIRPWIDSYWRRYWDDLNCVERQVTINRDLFQVRLDVHHFKSWEITVKVVGNSIVVKGKHDRRPKTDGYIERSFERRYDLSNDFKIRDISSTFSSDGVLTVKAFPQLPAITPAYIRNVPVLQTYRPSYLD